MSEVFIIGSTKIQTTKQVKINFLLKNFNMSIKLIRKIFTLNIETNLVCHSNIPHKNSSLSFSPPVDQNRQDR